MWDRENPYELQFLPGESCFKEEELKQKDEVLKLQQSIAAAQQKLKELRTQEALNDDIIKQLKGELQKKSASLVPNNGYSVDFAILLDSEDNLQWFKRRSHEMLESFTALQLEVPQHVIRVGVVFYNSQKSSSGGDCRVLQFTKDYQSLTQELPPLPKEATKNSPKKESKDHKNGKSKSTQNDEPHSNGADLDSSEENKNNEDSLLEDDDDKFLSQDTPKKVAALTPKTYEKKHRARTLAPSPSAFTPYSLPTDTSPQKKKRRNVVDLKETKDEAEQDTSDSWFQGLVASIKTPTKKPKLENETKDENTNNGEDKETSSEPKTPDSTTKKKTKTPTKESNENDQPDNETDSSQIAKEEEERASQEIQNVKQFYAEVDKMELGTLNTTPTRRTPTTTPQSRRTASFTRMSPASPTTSQASQSSQEYPRLQRSSSVNVPPTPPNTQQDDFMTPPVPT